MLPIQPEIEPQVPEYDCPLHCNIQFESQILWSRHMAIHHSDVRYGCYLCHRQFTHLTILFQHLKDKHEEFEPKMASISLARSKQPHQIIGFLVPPIIPKKKVEEKIVKSFDSEQQKFVRLEHKAPNLEHPKLEQKKLEFCKQKSPKIDVVMVGEKSPKVETIDKNVIMVGEKSPKLEQKSPKLEQNVIMLGQKCSRLEQKSPEQNCSIIEEKIPKRKMPELRQISPMPEEDVEKIEPIEEVNIEEVNIEDSNFDLEIQKLEQKIESIEEVNVEDSEEESEEETLQEIEVKMPENSDTSEIIEVQSESEDEGQVIVYETVADMNEVISGDPLEVIDQEIIVDDDQSLQISNIRSLNEEESISDDLILVCDDCLEVFTSRKDLNTHILDQHTKKVGKFDHIQNPFRNIDKVRIGCNICQGIIYATEVSSHFTSYHSDFCVFKNWICCEKCPKKTFFHNEETFEDHEHKFHGGILGKVIKTLPKSTSVSENHEVVILKSKRRSPSFEIPSTKRVKAYNKHTHTVAPNRPQLRITMQPKSTSGKGMVKLTFPMNQNPFDKK